MFSLLGRDWVTSCLRIGLPQARLHIGFPVALPSGSKNRSPFLPTQPEYWFEFVCFLLFPHPQCWAGSLSQHMEERVHPVLNNLEWGIGQDRLMVSTVEPGVSRRRAPPFPSAYKRIWCLRYHQLLHPPLSSSLFSLFTYPHPHVPQHGHLQPSVHLLQLQEGLLWHRCWL